MVCDEFYPQLSTFDLLRAPSGALEAPETPIDNHDIAGVIGAGVTGQIGGNPSEVAANSPSPLGYAAGNHVIHFEIKAGRT